MSNRNFDNRTIIHRLQNQVYARNLYTNNTSGNKLINNPQNTDGTASRFNSYIPGAQTEYYKGLMAGETVSVGGIVNIPPYTSVPSLSAVTVSTTAPAPAPSAPSPAPVPSAPSPAPVYVSGTQLLINPEFTDITNNGANGWISSSGWQAWGYASGNKPTAVTNMPTRTGVYPTSNSFGFVIFSFQLATISQTISISNLEGVDRITGLLNIVNVSNGAADNFTFQIQYKNSSGITLHTKSTGSTAAPASWNDYTLILTRDESPHFNTITTITVSIISKDTGFWAGQYGPAIDYCRLTVS